MRWSGAWACFAAAACAAAPAPGPAELNAGGEQGGVPPGRSEGWPPIQSDLPTYALTVAAADLDALSEHIDDRDLCVPAVFSYGGHSWDVEVRWRGRHTRYRPKKSWQVRFRDGETFQGRSRLELVAQWIDGGLLHEKTWYDLAAAAGLRVPRVRYVNLDLNGARYGVMTDIEAVDKSFLAAHDFDPDSDIYRCGMYDCELREPPRDPWQEEWEKRTNEDESWDALWALMAAIRRAPPSGLRAALEGALDLDAYIGWLAVDAAMGNNFVGDSRSFLVLDKREGRWTYVPWDLNNAVSLYRRTNGLRQSVKVDRPLANFTVFDPWAYDLADFRRAAVPEIRPAWSVLATRILLDDGLRARLVDAIRRLCEMRFREEEIGPRADALVALLAPHLALDPWVDLDYAASSAEQMRRYVRGRRAWLLAHLDDLDRLVEGPLRIVRAGVGPGGSTFAEVHNDGALPFSLDGLFVTGDLRDPTREAAPPQVLPPGARAWVPVAIDPARAEVGIFAADGRTPLAVHYPGALGP